MASNPPSPKLPSDSISEPNSSSTSPKPPTEPSSQPSTTQVPLKATQLFGSNCSKPILPLLAESIPQLTPQSPIPFQTPLPLSPLSPFQTPSPLSPLSPFLTPPPLPTLSPFQTPTHKTLPAPPPHHQGHSLPPSPSIASILRYIPPITYPTLSDLLIFPLFFFTTLYFINIQSVTIFCAILASFASVVYSCWIFYLIVKEEVKTFWDSVGKKYGENVTETMGMMNGGVFGGGRRDARTAGKVEDKALRQPGRRFGGIYVTPTSTEAVEKDGSDGSDGTTIRTRSGLFGGSAKKRGVML